MLTVNPFSLLAETISPFLMQSFVIIMVLLVVVGTLVDIIHKKNVKYFFENAKKAKKSAKKKLTNGEKTLRTIGEISISNCLCPNCWNILPISSSKFFINWGSTIFKKKKKN